MGRTEYTLDAINQRLKAGNVKVSIRQRGQSLSLVATLPPKPGSDRSSPHQQTIALGVPASEDGFRRAEAEARRVGSLLALKEFDWSLYIEDGGADRNLTRDLVERFKAHYMSTHSLSQATWHRHWDGVFRRLPQDKPLELAVLLETVHATPRNSRNRLHTCKKLQKLADFAGLKINLLQYQGNYGNSQVEREIPSDEIITQSRSLISNPAWQWVFGMMAAFGLRDHECWFCEFKTDGLQILKGKTGARLVFAALYPEWVEQWNLKEGKPPRLDLSQGFGYLGDRTSTAFRRYKIPFTPYDLRHAWAIRASVRFGFPIPTSAALMGHSAEVHLKTYQKHISEATHRETSRRILEDANRPKPPDVLKDSL